MLAGPSLSGMWAPTDTCVQKVAFSSSSSSFGLVLLLAGPDGPGHRNMYAFNLHE